MSQNKFLGVTKYDDDVKRIVFNQTPQSRTGAEIAVLAGDAGVCDSPAKVYPTARAFTRNPQVRLRRRVSAHRVDCASVCAAASNRPTHVWSVGSNGKCWGAKETSLALFLTICTPTFDIEPKINPTQQSVGRKSLWLRLFDSANRTLCCTRTTINAEICRDFEFAVAFADSVARTNTLAAAACNTFVTYFVSHNRILSFLG